MNSKKNVLIVGGGIAGLALANLLDTNKFNSTIIEKKTVANEDGYIIGIWANGLHALKNMPDLFSNLVEKGIISEFQSLTTASGRKLRYTNLQKLNQKYGGVVVFTSRGALHQALQKPLEKTLNIRFGTSISQLQNGKDNVTVTFENGVIETYDFVFGADGLNSSTRDFIEKDNAIVKHNADFFYCTLPVQENLPKITGDIEMIGNGDYVGVYPYNAAGDLGLYMCIANAPKNQATLPLLKEKLRYFESPFKECLAVLDENTTIFRDTLREVKLKNWYNNRVVLLGDAAHALLPTTGQGISAALEDATLLADLLNKSDDFSAAFAQYQGIRKPLVDSIQGRSQLINSLVLLQNPFLCWCRNVLIGLAGLLPKEKSLDKFFEKALAKK